MPCQPLVSPVASVFGTNLYPGTSVARTPTRSATEEEENWLNTQERLECEAIMQRVAENHSSLEELIAEAQTFDEEAHLHAEEQEAQECDDLETAYLEALAIQGEFHEMEKRHGDLLWGSEAVCQAGVLEKSSIPQLLATQQSFLHANQLIHDTLQKALGNGLTEAFLENERLQRELKFATNHFRALSALAAAELEEARGYSRVLEDKLEAADNRISCRICYDKPRNVLPMPCLHFEYCHRCLKEHRKRSNTCPTCRTPLAGVLKCELNVD